MHYIVDYEICSLVILIAVGIRFFTLKRFPDFTCRLFGFMIVCGVVDIILDVLACFAIDGIDRIPVWLCTGLNLAFYVVQSAMPMLMMSFIATLCRTFTRERIRRYWYLFAPYVGILLLIATNPIHHLFFRVAQVGTKLVCSGGIGTYLIYMCCCF